MTYGLLSIRAALARCCGVVLLLLAVIASFPAFAQQGTTNFNTEDCASLGSCFRAQPNTANQSFNITNSATCRFVDNLTDRPYMLPTSGEGLSSIDTVFGLDLLGLRLRRSELLLDRCCLPTTRTFPAPSNPAHRIGGGAGPDSYTLPLARDFIDGQPSRLADSGVTLEVVYNMRRPDVVTHNDGSTSTNYVYWQERHRVNPNSSCDNQAWTDNVTSEFIWEGQCVDNGITRTWQRNGTLSTHTTPPTSCLPYLDCPPGIKNGETWTDHPQPDERVDSFCAPGQAGEKYEIVQRNQPMICDNGVRRAQGAETLGNVIAGVNTCTSSPGACYRVEYRGRGGRVLAPGGCSAAVNTCMVDYDTNATYTRDELIATGISSEKLTGNSTVICRKSCEVVGENLTGGMGPVNVLLETVAFVRPATCTQPPCALRWQPLTSYALGYPIPPEHTGLPACSTTACTSAGQLCSELYAAGLPGGPFGVVPTLQIQTCSVPATCLTYSWQLSGTCSGACGTGTEAYVCKDNNSNTVADSNCTGSKPAARSCTLPNTCSTDSGCVLTVDYGQIDGMEIQPGENVNLSNIISGLTYQNILDKQSGSMCNDGNIGGTTHECSVYQGGDGVYFRCGAQSTPQTMCTYELTDEYWTSSCDENGCVRGCLQSVIYDCGSSTKVYVTEFGGSYHMHATEAGSGRACTTPDPGVEQRFRFAEPTRAGHAVPATDAVSGTWIGPGDLAMFQGLGWRISASPNMHGNYFICPPAPYLWGRPVLEEGLCYR